MTPGPGTTIAVPTTAPNFTSALFAKRAITRPSIVPNANMTSPNAATTKPPAIDYHPPHGSALHPLTIWTLIENDWTLLYLTCLLLLLSPILRQPDLAPCHPLFFLFNRIFAAASSACILLYRELTGPTPSPRDNRYHLVSTFQNGGVAFTTTLINTSAISLNLVGRSAICCNLSHNHRLRITDLPPSNQILCRHIWTRNLPSVLCVVPSSPILLTLPSQSHHSRSQSVVPANLASSSISASCMAPWLMMAFLVTLTSVNPSLSACLVLMPLSTSYYTTVLAASFTRRT